MFLVRRSRPGEGPLLMEVWRRAVDATHHFLSAADREEIEREVSRFLPDAGPMWVAATDDEGDRPVAFMLLSDCSSGVHLDALFVDPDARGRGVGRLLVAHALAAARSPQLTTEVNEQNAQAVGFYLHLGFVVTGRSDTDDAGRPYPLLHLRHRPSSNLVSSSSDICNRSGSGGASGHSIGAGLRSDGSSAKLLSQSAASSNGCDVSHGHKSRPQQCQSGSKSCAACCENPDPGRGAAWTLKMTRESVMRRLALAVHSRKMRLLEDAQLQRYKDSQRCKAVKLAEKQQAQLQRNLATAQTQREQVRQARLVRFAGNNSPSKARPNRATHHAGSTQSPAKPVAGLPGKLKAD